MSNLDEVAGQDVEQEAADEVEGGQCAAAAALRGEANGAIVDGDETLVGDADPMSVAAEIVENLLGTTEGSLGVDDPALPVEPVLPPREGGIVGQVGARAGEGEQPTRTRLRERREGSFRGTGRPSP